jgi:hypothetical protein
MQDGPLKTAAFQTILGQLVERALSDARPRSRRAFAAQMPKTNGRSSAGGTTGRLLDLVGEGFFGQPRSLSDVKHVLAERGWHYRLADLGTPTARLVRRQYLRRSQAAVGGKRIWRYSNY